MKIAIVDDEVFWCEKVKNIINDFVESDIDINIELYCSGDEYLLKEEVYEVTFIDVEMPGTDGFETIKKARDYNENGYFVIMSTHEELSRYGYKVDAFRYIYKRNLEEEVREALNSIFFMHNQKKVVSLNILGEGEKRLELKNIICFQTNKKRNVEINTKKGTLLSSNTMTEIEEKLEGTSFFRCHMGCIVNLDEIECIKEHVVYLSDGSDVDVAIKKTSDLKKKYSDRLYECASG